MRLVVQRVRSSTVAIDNKTVSAIGKGMLVLAGIETEDTEEDLIYLCSKLCSLRIFADTAGKMNLDIKQAGGDMLVVSQFTLHASTKKGNRPSFIKAARPEHAIPLYEKFLGLCAAELGKPCQAGVFGADMQVSLVNDGPVTILMDSKNRE